MDATLKINENDIYGKIKGFPLEIVQRMVELTMREEHINSDEALKVLRNTPWNGFTWAETDEGGLFWSKVIYSHEWWRFYKRYPVNLSSPFRYAVVKDDNGGFPEEIAGYLGTFIELSGKGKIGDIYFAYPSIDGFGIGFAIKGSPRYKRIIKNGIKL